jgi:CRISPR-associated protein Cas5d
MFERRASKGQCFNQPYLGCREFSCSFKLVNQTSDLLQPINESLDLGFMLYDINFTDKKNPIPQFFRAIMTNGTINTDKREIEVIE